MQQNSAVSEVIGAILLISLVVLAVAIVGVGFLSQPPPVQTQDLNVIAGYNETSKVLYLQHDGGDLMTPGEYYILIDGGSPIYRGEWGIGGSLTFSDVLEEPERIQIISTRGGQQNLIREVRVGQVTGGVAPVGPGPQQPVNGNGNGGDCDPDFVVENFTERLTTGSVYFTRLERGNAAYLHGFINFTVSSPGSYLDYGSGQSPLTEGSQVSIFVAPPNPRRNPEIRLLSLGGKGWSMMLIGTGNDVGEIRVNDNLEGTILRDSWITSFTEFESSFTIYIDDNKAQPTRLIIENTTWVDANNSDTFELINIRPAEPEFLMLHYPQANGDPILFIGHADMVKQGGGQIYPQL